MALSLNKNWLILAGAIALGGMAFFLSNKAINSRIEEIEEAANRGKTLVPIVVAKRPLHAGEFLDPSVVAVRQIPSEFANGNMVNPDTYDAVHGQPLTVDIQEGEPIMTAFTASRGGEIFAATLKDGRRALTIEVDEISSMSGMLRPGDRIDLMLTAKPPGADSTAKEFTFPMLSNVEVLATGQAQKGVAAAGDAAARAYSHVTLDLTPQDATRVIAAKSGGKLTAVLRAPSDRVANPSRALTIDDVVASNTPRTSGPGATPRLIEFIIGGSGGKVSRTPALDVAMQDSKNQAVAEQVARLMGANEQQQTTALQPANTEPQPRVVRDTPPPTQVDYGSRDAVPTAGAGRGQATGFSGSLR